MDLLTELIEKRLHLKRQIDELTTQLNGVDEQLKEEMATGEIAYSRDGVGYQLATRTITNYGDDAVALAKELGILEQVVKIQNSLVDKQPDHIKDRLLEKSKEVKIQMFKKVADEAFITR